jgi:hypothetical protein
MTASLRRRVPTACPRRRRRGELIGFCRFRGLPGPAGTYPFKLSTSRLQFGSPVAGAARWFLNFEGTFDCHETENGTVVTHREVFEFKRPWRWLAEPVLRRWLETDMGAEMVRFKDLLDADSNSSNAASA